ncbi:MAG: AAA family ATPase, partial [Gammaproteobacteria bacterium]|nr:AAA family ATPase [Gammaproteobacteria bacterium]
SSRNSVDVFGARNLVDEAGHVQHAGVVLIDEIDAHLHPKWQREIGSWFKRIFPRIQFLVTTHSPLICQEADHGSIFHLPIPSGEEKPFRVSNSDYQKIITGKPDTILLTSAFGLKHTRSVTAVKARNEYSLLQTKKRQASLTKEEEKRQMELSCFVDEEEPCEE